MPHALLTEFHQKLTYKRVTKNHIHDDRLKQLYKDIIDLMAADYAVYQENVALFLASLEENNESSMKFAVDHFWEQSEFIVKELPVFELDNTSIEGEADGALVDRYYQSITKQLKHQHIIRISDENISFDEFSIPEQRALAGLFIEKLQIDGKNLNWDMGMVQDHLNQFSWLRQLLKKLNGLELFYHAFGLFLDRLASSELNQLGRNVSEEILSTSFKDEMAHLGFYNNFRFYSSTNSVHAGLMYANLTARNAIRNGGAVSDKFKQEILWQGIKFFRNIDLYSWAGKFYKLIPEGLFKDDYHRRAVDHTYFLALLSDHNTDLPSEILDYLNKERESIFQGGVHETLPWLITLLNIRRIYEGADFSAAGLGFYLNVFEQIVPEKHYKKQKDIIDGGTENLKPILRESLKKLDATNYERDLVYDNENALKVSNRLIPFSVEKKDAEGFLLAMVVKSDISVMFKQHPVGTETTLAETEDPDYLTVYEQPEKVAGMVNLKKGEVIVWIAVSEHDVYQLTLINNKYEYAHLKNWSTKEYRRRDADSFFTGMSFSETKRVNGQIKTFFAEDFLEEAKGYKAALEFSKIFIPADAQAVYFVNDMLLARFPHQMFLNMEGQFISELLPTANILSLDWLVSQTNKNLLPATLTKSIWVPTESGDFALIYLEQFIDQALVDYQFTRHNSIKIDKPLSSDINIVCSHGGSDIAEIQIVSHENTVTFDLNHIVGPGKILILFVCHAGSKQNEMFRNNIASLVKKFISKGYQAVIAPAWALDISVPRFWLPVFLDCIEKGLPVDQAVFMANKKVYEMFPTPAAWANLHLHGNPHLKKD